MSIDISVIVPVYNAEKYLPQCVESLLQQTKKEFELIFVDDGSTDNSVEILEQYRAKDDRIKILRQQNQYAGVARNNGMAAAAGKYLMFLDADDFFERNMLEELYRAAERHQAQIVVCGYYIYDDLTKKKLSSAILPSVASGVYTPENLGKNIFSFSNAAPWNKLLLKDFVLKSGICFQPVKKCNDTFFSRMTVALAKKIVVTHKCYVYYRTNNALSLQGNISKGMDCFAKAAIDIKQELVKRNMYQGDFRAAFIREATDLIYLSFGKFEKIENADIIRLLYMDYKENTLLKIFDDLQEIPSNSCAYHIYLSHSFEEFLIRLIADYQKNYFPKDSWRFRIGNFVCSPLGRLKQLFRG